MVASVSALSSAGQAASYYEADDYYAEGGMAPSEWFGEAAEKLGLSGEVDREQFADLLEGRVAGQQLGTTRDGKVEHRPGWDITLSAPKSVSIMAEVAGDTPATDTITMPDRERFFATASGSAAQNWYATLLHELVHWSGADHRLARTFGKRFGDDAYAMEELVAELGSAFLCGDLGLSASPRPDHASYLASWLKVLKADNRAIFTAASAATKAVEWLEETKE